MLIDRNILNKNFKQMEVKDGKWFDLLFLNKLIDIWKSYLYFDLNLKKGNTIGFAMTHMDINYFGLFFACAELGLKIVILDWKHQTTEDSLRLKSILPLDLYLYNNTENRSVEWYMKYAKDIVDVRNIKIETILDRASSIDLTVTSDDEFLVCNTSGTTKTPRIVELTHGFLYNVAYRNTQFFNDSETVVHIRNLHHGSSLATYFLPTLIASSNHICYGYNENVYPSHKRFIKLLTEYKVNAVQFPYVEMVDRFLLNSRETNIVLPNLRIFTLSYILPDWQQYIKKYKIKEIISLFGSSETSGPILVSTLKSKKLFNPKYFHLVDDFYQLKIKENKTLVHCEGKEFILNDKFKKIKKNIFEHQGRTDLLRINDIVVNLKTITGIPYEFDINANIICDELKNAIYIAFWEDYDFEEVVKQLNLELKERHNSERIFIKKYKKLNKVNYFAGIKLDMELLREEFRKNDNE